LVCNSAISGIGYLGISDLACSGFVCTIDNNVAFDLNVDVSTLLLFHVTQLFNRINTENHCVMRKPIVSGNKNKSKHNGGITD